MSRRMKSALGDNSKAGCSPLKATVPAVRTAAKHCLADAGRPAASMQTSVPRPAVSSRMVATTSVASSTWIVCVAPNARAISRRLGTTSTTITSRPRKLCSSALPRPMGPMPKMATDSIGSFLSFVEVW